MALINPIPFPAIQGVRTDHSSLQFMINGVEIIPGAGNQMKYGLRSWTWKSGLAPQALEGAAAQPVGWTRGKYSGEGEMEWWRADADNLEAFLMNSSGGRQGLYEIWFLMMGFINEPSLPLPSTIACWARIKERSSESKDGPHSKKYPLLYAVVNENNIMESTGLVFPGSGPSF